ncbi:hypothetical protein Q1695_013494 [Nippostrongylus brasiliensis]|nr:hypothetical protein Q1695_013494 [Nippostrongylus brasiliensis]
MRRVTSRKMDTIKPMENLEIVDHVEPDDRAWLEWKTLVEDEGWTSDDLSVLTLTPKLPSTRIVLARRKDDGKFVGTVIWNEYDEVAFIGFYLLVPEYREKGIGSTIWRRAIDRMPKNYTIALRAVPDMAARYRSMDTPVQGSVQHMYKMHWTKLLSIAESKASKNGVIKLVSDLTDAEYQQLDEFCNWVTKRNRSDFLRKFHDLPFTMGAVLFDRSQKVGAFAAICPTSHESSHLFKLAPLYSWSLGEAFAVIRPLIESIGSLHADAQILIHTLSETIGAHLLIPLFNSLDIPIKQCGETLFSKEYHNPIDAQRVFIAHNNSGHFDA